MTDVKADVQTIDTDKFEQQVRDDVGVHVWNVLTDAFFKGDMIPGSRRVPLDTLPTSVGRATLTPDAAIIVYCAGPKCPASRQAAEQLAALGFANVRAYEGGL